MYCSITNVDSIKIFSAESGNFAGIEIKKELKQWRIFI